MLPDIHNEHLTGRKRKKSTLALKVLVLASFATISTLHIHHQDVVRHADAFRGRITLLLVLRQPNTFGCLPALLLGHDRELSTEQVVQQGGLAGRLRSKHGDEVVIEAGCRHIFEGEILGQVRTAEKLSASKLERKGAIARRLAAAGGRYS